MIGFQVETKAAETVDAENDGVRLQETLLLVATYPARIMNETGIRSILLRFHLHKFIEKNYPQPSTLNPEP